MSDAAQGQQGGGGGKVPVKVAAIVAGVMLLEGVAVFAGVKLMMGPQTAAAGLEGLEQAAQEQTHEVPLVHEQYQNIRGGRPWRWEVEVLLQVQQRNLDRVNVVIEQRDAEIREGIGQIFRAAQSRHLEEPELATLRRQLTAYLNEVFGVDGEGNPRISRVLIPTCKGAPGDF
jgi:flagellar basal body-associated protein FliL